MKVMFKLNDTQMKIAMSVLALTKQVPQPSEEKRENYFHAGNLMGYKEVGPNTNKRQQLTLTPSNGYIIYEGDRHALVKDGALDVLRRISGGNLRFLRCTLYETTDQTLMWHQTTEVFILKAPEVMFLNWVGRKDKLTSVEQAALKQRLSTMKGTVIGQPVELGTSAHKKLVAAGETWKVKLINRVHRLAA